MQYSNHSLLKKFVLTFSNIVLLFAYIASVESSELYLPKLEISLKGGNKRSIVRPGVVLPILQTRDTLTYVNLIFMGDNNQALEGNFGIGYRRIVNDKQLFGIFGHYDIRKSPYGNKYHQRTIGLEWFVGLIELRGNIYLPYNEKNSIASSKKLKAKVYNHRVRIDSGKLTRSEKPLAGFDAEFGSAIPGRNNISAHIAYYRFGQNCQGVRGRAALQLNKVLTVDSEVSYDPLRKISYFLGCKLSWEFGSRKEANPLTYLQKKMTINPVRDIDIVINDQILDFSPEHTFNGSVTEEFVIEHDGEYYVHKKGNLVQITVDQALDYVKKRSKALVVTNGKGEFKLLRTSKCSDNNNYKNEKASLRNSTGTFSKIKAINDKDFADIMSDGGDSIRFLPEEKERVNSLTLSQSSKIEIIEDQEGVETFASNGGSNNMQWSTFFQGLKKLLSEQQKASDTRVQNAINAMNGVKSKPNNNKKEDTKTSGFRASRAIGIIKDEQSDGFTVVANTNRYQPQQQYVQPTQNTQNYQQPQQKYSPSNNASKEPVKVEKLNGKPLVSNNKPKPKKKALPKQMKIGGNKVIKNTFTIGQMTARQEEMKKLKAKPKFDFSKMGGIFAGAKRKKSKVKQKSIAELQKSANSSGNSKGTDPRKTTASTYKHPMVGGLLIPTSGKDATICYHGKPVIVKKQQYKNNVHSLNRGGYWFLRAVTYHKDTGGFWKFNGDDNSVLEYTDKSFIKDAKKC